MTDKIEFTEEEEKRYRSYMDFGYSLLTPAIFFLYISIRSYFSWPFDNMEIRNAIIVTSFVIGDVGLIIGGGAIYLINFENISRFNLSDFDGKPGMIFQPTIKLFKIKTKSRKYLKYPLILIVLIELTLQII